jgi:phage regulator Rha-like protein
MNQMNITVMCPTHHAAAMGQQITMSSREIAKLVDSRHSNVCVPSMNSGVIGGYAAMQYTHQNQQVYHYYEVNKRDSYVIVAQLCPSLPPVWLTAGRNWRAGRNGGTANTP